MLKILLTLILFSTQIYAMSLSEQLLVKKENYQKIFQVYKELESDLLQGKEKIFCSKLEDVTQSFYQIYLEDIDLMWALADSKDEDFLEYAKHLNENSKSDLFSINYFKNRCDNDLALTALKSFKNIYINQNFLQMTHHLWIESFCADLSGDCKAL